MQDATVRYLKQKKAIFSSKCNLNYIFNILEANVTGLNPFLYKMWHKISNWLSKPIDDIDNIHLFKNHKTSIRVLFEKENQSVNRGRNLKIFEAKKANYSV